MQASIIVIISSAQEKHLDLYLVLQTNNITIYSRWSRGEQNGQRQLPVNNYDVF